MLTKLEKELVAKLTQILNENSLPEKTDRELRLYLAELIKNEPSFGKIFD